MYLKNGINLLTAPLFTYFLLKGFPVEFSAICKTPYLLTPLLKYDHYLTHAVWRRVMDVANIQRVVFPVSTSNRTSIVTREPLQNLICPLQFWNQTETCMDLWYRDVGLATCLALCSPLNQRIYIRANATKGHTNTEMLHDPNTATTRVNTVSKAIKRYVDNAPSPLQRLNISWGHRSTVIIKLTEQLPLSMCGSQQLLRG